MNYRVGHTACWQDSQCPLLLLRAVTISCEQLGLAIIATCSVFGYGGTFWGFVIMPMLGWLILESIVSFNSKSELIVPQLLFVISYLLTYFLVRDTVLANPKAFLSTANLAAHFLCITRIMCTH